MKSRVESAASGFCERKRKGEDNKCTVKIAVGNYTGEFENMIKRISINIWMRKVTQYCNFQKNIFMQKALGK